MTAVAPLNSQPQALQNDPRANKNAGPSPEDGGEGQTIQLVTNCPPGLEPFLNLDALQMRFIRPGCCGGGLKFDILKMDEQILLKSLQVTSCFGIGLTVTVNTPNSALAVSARREYGCLFYCDNGLRVEAPQGNLIGYVTLKPDAKPCECRFSCTCELTCIGKCCKKSSKESCCGNCCSCCAPTNITLPKLFVMNADREVVLTINEDKTITCFSVITDQLDKICPSRDDLIYSLRANNASLIGAGEQIGVIRKKYPGRCCPDPDHYTLNMPADLDVRMKTLVVCSVFFMKYLNW